MRASGTFTLRDLPATEAEVAQALTDAGLPAGAARSWLSSAAGRVQSDGRWSLDYDAELQIASFEVWLDGRMVFGIDDWLPAP